MSNVKQLKVTPVPDTLIEVLPGSPIPKEAVGSVAVGDKRTGDRIPAVTLRHLAEKRGGKLGKGKPTANAVAASSELDRRKSNRVAKKAAAAVKAKKAVAAEAKAKKAATAEAKAA